MGLLLSYFAGSLLPTDTIITCSSFSLRPVPVILLKCSISLRVWGETTEAVDCGDETARWLSKFLCRDQLDYRLVYHREGLKTRRCDAGPTRWHQAAKPHDSVSLTSHVGLKFLGGRFSSSCCYGKLIASSLLFTHIMRRLFDGTNFIVFIVPYNALVSFNKLTIWLLY